jgi:protoporphyrin/coproporphyrin ferrochelatase
MSDAPGGQALTDGQGGRTGVLLSNLGTPDAPTAAAVRRYLREFLSDRRVVNLPPLLWWPILNGVILTIRPRKSAHAYRRVWRDDGSPLLVISEQQLAALKRRFSARDDLVFALGMRYGTPSIRSALESLRDAGAERVIVLPLYPQYSSATTASTFDAVAGAMRRWIAVPGVNFIAHYFDQPWYHRAVAASIRDAWRGDPQAERLLFSFHGMPRATRDAGDPYYRQCEYTARAIARELALTDERWHMSFQSRFGAQEWLQPYTDKTLEAWGGSGVESVDVVCPGFSADCLETLEEIEMLNRDIFIEAGGHRYRYIPALNSRDDHMDGLAGMIERLCPFTRSSRA